MQRSSQCTLTESVDPAQLIESLGPAHKYTFISTDSFVPPDSRAVRVSLRLRSILEHAEMAVSVARNDLSDRFLLKDGVLYFMLSAESFAAFGLDAQRVNLVPQLRGHQHRHQHQQYLAVYDLKQTTSQKRLDRLKWALEHTVVDLYDAFVLPKRDAAAALAGDAAAAATTAAATTIETVPRPFSAAPTVDVPPLLPPAGKDEFTDWSVYLTEWIGLCVLNPKLLDSRAERPDASLCAFHIYPDSQRSAAVAVTHAQGLFTAADLIGVWEQTQSRPWAVLHVQGFASAPVAWAKNGAQPYGERGYTLVRAHGVVYGLKYV